MKHFLAAMIGLLMSVSAAAAPQKPEQVIQSGTDQMRALIKQNLDTYRKDKGTFYKSVDEVLVPHFDVKYIAQLILARNWRGASDDQRTRFQTAFKNMLVRSYADALLDYYDSVKIDYKPAYVENVNGQNNATVDSQLYRPNVQQPVAISFKLHQVGDDWLIYDVIVENISLVINFRTQVGAEIKKTSLDDVIARMEKGEVIKPETSNAAVPGQKVGSAG
jgi:phospholipid transport system substrate-binding protein